MDTERAPQRILRELETIAFANTVDAVTIRDGSLALADLDDVPHIQRAIASVEKTSTGIRLKFYDKLKALELLGKALGLFEGTAPEQENNNLLEAILQATEKEVCTHDLPELQQTPDARHDLVEPAESCPP